MQGLDRLIAKLTAPKPVKATGTDKRKAKPKVDKTEVIKLEFGELFKFRNSTCVKLTHNRYRKNITGAEPMFISPNQMVERVRKTFSGADI